MIPTNLIFSNSSTLCNSSVLWTDKETQTSNIDIVSSNPSIQIVGGKASQNMCGGKSAPQCFQHVEVIKDPKNPGKITVVKDTFSEEMMDSGSKRMVFCREVVAPILPEGEKKCPSEEIEIECDPCLDSSGCLEDMKQNIQNKNSNDSISCSSKSSKTSCTKKMPSCFSNCSSRKTNNSSCTEKTIKIKQPKCPNEKPTYYIVDKKPSNNQYNTNCGKRESSCEAATNIASKVQSFIGSAYNKSKEVFALVASESCRQLKLDKKPSSDSSENDEKCKTDKNKKKSKVEQCSYKKGDEEDETHPVIDTASFQNTIKQPMEFVNNITSTLESTVTYVGDLSMDKVIVDRIESNMNRSSEYDNPSTNAPAQESMIDFNISPNNLFETIKSKIFSIFGNSSKEPGDDGASKGD